MKVPSDTYYEALSFIDWHDQNNPMNLDKLVADMQEANNACSYDLYNLSEESLAPFR